MNPLHISVHNRVFGLETNTKRSRAEAYGGYIGSQPKSKTEIPVGCENPDGRSEQ